MTYDRDDIELYLPCVWDEDYWINPPRKVVKSSIDPSRYRYFETLTGSRLENAIEPDKRGSVVNPKLSNTVWAVLVDIKRGWEIAELTDKQRAALFLAYGLPPAQRFTHGEIAFNQQVDRSTITKRLDAAITKILGALNGDEVPDEYEEEVA